MSRITTVTGGGLYMAAAKKPAKKAAAKKPAKKAAKKK